jgi:hypothetical protein
MLHLDEVTEACGLSYSTLYRVVKEASKPQKDDEQSTPGEKRLRKKTKTALDDFDLCVVRRIINKFHNTEGKDIR